MRRFFLFPFVLAGLAGCAGNDLLVQRQSSMEGRLEQVMQASKSDKADYAAVVVQLQELKEQFARQAATEKELQQSYEALRIKVSMLANRLEQVEAAAREPAAIELINQESSDAGREESVQAVYMKAFGLFSANNYQEAAGAFEAFIAAYPESEYAANARYWLGECYFSSGRYREAIDAFTRVAEMNPASGRGAETQFRIGLAWYSLNDKTKGAAALRRLIERYPESEPARKAREKLAQEQLPTGN